MFRRFFLMFLLLAGGAAGAAAQTSVEQSVKSARDQFSDIKNRSIELERMKREANKRPAANDTSAFPLIKEDFEEIQKINIRVYEPTAAKAPINYSALLKSVTEIKDRAERLWANLFSVDLKFEETAKTKLPLDVKSADIPALLKTLDRSINSFVHSPLFQNTNLVNSQDSLKAQTDLETIVVISSLIKEKAKKLKKENSKE